MNMDTTTITTKHDPRQHLASATTSNTIAMHNTTCEQAHSYWDTVPASQRRDLAEQLIMHGQSHYPASNRDGFGTAGIKHPDCFWCCVGAHLDCDYDFLKKIPKEKLDEIASFARAFFYRDCYLPNNNAENGDMTRENTDTNTNVNADTDTGTGAENIVQKGDPS